MPTYNENLVVNGEQDVQQLRVQGHTTQNQALQTWENSAGTVQAQVTGDGNLIVGTPAVNTQMTKDGRMIAGDDLGVATPDALLEVHRAETSSTRPTRGVHSLGQLTGALTSLVQWMVGELELRGASAINALHTALRIRASNMNTGTPGANAELRGADVEVINEVSAGSAALPKATGIQASVTNATGKTITDAAALRLKLNNAGTITSPYSIFTEGPGVAHFEDYLEVKRPTNVPGTPPTDFMRLYPKSDGKLYARNWSGAEIELGGGAAGGAIALLIDGILNSPAAQIDIASLAIPIPNTYRHLMLVLEIRSERAAINDGLRIRFNNDQSTTNYANLAYSIAGSTPAFNGQTISTNGIVTGGNSVPAAQATANYFSSLVLHIFDYKSPRLRRVSHSGFSPLSTSALHVIQGGGFWLNTVNPIYMISILSWNAANLAVNSRYALYGLS
jgi:hypothetical protein